jgi:hypothetical protein
MTGLAEAFGAFGAKGKNSRWSWSARTADGKVVMTFWKDQMNYSSEPISYSTFGGPNLALWKDRLGNQERIDNLKWARDNCSGLMHVVIIEAVDEQAQPRSIARSFPHKRLLMKLIELNEETGEFSAINVGR